jgi:hypothetical protein
VLIHFLARDNTVGPTYRVNNITISCVGMIFLFVLIMGEA